MPISSDTCKKLAAIVGDSALLTDPVQLLGYENDGLGFHRHTPDAVVLPRNSEEVRKVIELMTTEDLPYLVRGAGTSLSGGPTPLAGGLVIHL